MARLDGTISLRFLRKLAAAATGTSFDSFAKSPVYLNVGGRLYEVADFSYVAGPHSSHVEIQAGRELTDREARQSERKVIDDYPQVVR
jgi:predicted heme/steroid binding protein